MFQDVYGNLGNRWNETGCREQLECLWIFVV